MIPFLFSLLDSHVNAVQMELEQTVHCEFAGEGHSLPVLATDVNVMATRRDVKHAWIIFCDFMSWSTRLVLRWWCV